jgi:hypothetical protein
MEPPRIPSRRFYYQKYKILYRIYKIFYKTYRKHIEDI